MRAATSARVQARPGCSSREPPASAAPLRTPSETAQDSALRAQGEASPASEKDVRPAPAPGLPARF